LSKNIHAFPRPNGCIPTSGVHVCNDSQQGMTLRDYFAAKALQSILSGTVSDDHKRIAQESYKLADAMLEERTWRHRPPVTSTE